MAKANRIFKQMSMAEYLEFEEKSPLRHEYVRGLVVAMTGAREGHNVICGNLFSKLHQALENSDCRAFINDMKVHAKEADCFYYPDIMVTCEPFDADCAYKSEPVLLVEVLWPSTEQTDRREKRSAYQQIPSLRQYVIVHQKRMQIDVFNRLSDVDWEMISIHKTGELELRICPNETLKVSVASIYKGIDFTPTVREPDEEDEYEQQLVFM